MIKRLNIVNGDACIEMMKKAGISGDFLAWQDFLHEGPVPTKLPLEELSVVRAKFIAEYGFGQFDEIQKNFASRDEKLKSFRDYDKVVLWFEYDLYDQLQLLQLLSWFAKQALKETKLTLIATNNYLGDLSAKQIEKLAHYEIEITPKHFEVATKAWLAFGQETPKEWAKLLDESTSILPYLNGAVQRMLEEYPHVEHGLSRSAYQALQVISQGTTEPFDVFQKCQSLEERKFMGDALFWKILETFETYGVLTRKKGELQLTPLGEELLAGQKSWFAIAPFQRAIGGVNLTLEHLWCWDKTKQTIKPYYYSTPLETLLGVI
jgi:hypothetical protein